MAKKAVKKQASKGKARTIASSARRDGKGATSRKEAKAPARARAASASKASAASAGSRTATADAPPSTDIRRAYKSSLLAGFLGGGRAGSSSSSKK